MQKLISYSLISLMVVSPIYSIANTPNLPISPQDQTDISSESNNPTRMSLKKLQAGAAEQSDTSHASNMNPQSVSIGVNPATLAPTANIDLASLSLGAEGNFALSLSYNRNQSTVYNAPHNWSFSLPYIDNGRLSYNGNIFVIDDKWTDINGYQSGLRYMNSPDVKFTNYPDEQTLPTKEGSYKYKLKLKDDSVLYFDHYGKVILEADNFDNYIYFNYESSTSTPKQAHVKDIVDSLGKKVSFVYGGGSEIKIIIGGDYRWKIDIGSYGINTVTDPIGSYTSFEYGSYDGEDILNTIKEASGLSTNIQYQKLPYYKNQQDKDSSNTSWMSVVSGISVSDQSQGGKILSHKSYSFQPDATQANYTGYPQYPIIDADGHSPLADSNSTNFRFSISTEEKNGSGNKTSILTYNYLALPVEAYQTGSDGQKIKTITKYNIDNDAHSRSANFTLPTEVTNYKYSGGWQSKSKKEYQYDGNGNPTNIVQYDYDSQAPGGKVSETKFTYQGKLVKSKTSELYSGRSSSYDVLVENNTISSDAKHIDSSTYSLNGHASRSISYTYNNHGYLTSKRVGKASSDNGSISSITDNYSYSGLSTGGNTWSITHTDALGNKTTKTYDKTYNNLISSTAPDGGVTKYTYDNMSRVTSETSPLGMVVTKEYNNYQQDGSNSVVISGPTYQAKKVYDALGRTLDSYATINPNSDSLVKVGSQAYDMWGNVISKTDMYGNISTMSYDGLGQIVSSTDEYGNTTKVDYDYVNNSATTAVNGKVAMYQQFDNSGNVLKSIIYPGPSKYKKVGYTIIVNYARDGSGRVVNKSVYQGNGSSEGKELFQESITYNAQGLIESENVTRGNVNIEINNTYDITDSLVQATKSISGDDVSASRTSDVFTHDALGRVLESRSSEGYILKYKYDDSNNTLVKTYPSGRTVTSVSDTDGKPVSVTYKKGSNTKKVSYSYDSLSRLVTVSDNEGGSQSYSYVGNSDSVKSSSYADGTSSSVSYDEYGRTIDSVNYMSQKSTFVYDSYGRVSSKKDVSGNYSYKYGTDDNGQKGALLSVTNPQYTEVSHQDGLGRIVSTERTKNGKTLVSYDNDYDVYSNLVTSKVSSDIDSSSTSNYTATYNYDDLNQLIESNKNNTQTLYTYDDNGNILTKSETLNGSTKESSYKYDADDKLIEFTNNAGTYTPTYDADGNMISDGTGSEYSFDETGYLLEAKTSGKEVTYNYYPDGLRKQRTADKRIQTFYYNGSQEISSISDDAMGKLGFIRGSGGLLASYNEEGTIKNNYLSTDTHDSINLTMSKGASNGDNYSIDSRTSYGDYGSKEASQSNSIDSPLDSFGYNGEYQDQVTKLVYLRARDYSPDLHRFISRDSYNMWNHYNFADGNPIGNIDPSGHMASWVSSAIIGAVAIGFSALSGGTLSGVGAAIAAVGVGAVFSAGDILNNELNHTGSKQWIDLGIAVTGIVTSVIGEGALYISVYKYGYRGVSKVGLNVSAILTGASVVSLGLSYAPIGDTAKEVAGNISLGLGLAGISAAAGVGGMKIVQKYKARGAAVADSYNNEGSISFDTFLEEQYERHMDELFLEEQYQRHMDDVVGRIDRIARRNASIEMEQFNDAIAESLATGNIRPNYEGEIPPRSQNMINVREVDPYTQDPFDAGQEIVWHAYNNHGDIHAISRDGAILQLRNGFRNCPWCNDILITDMSAGIANPTS